MLCVLWQVSPTEVLVDLFVIVFVSWQKYYLLMVKSANLYWQFLWSYLREGWGMRREGEGKLGGVAG